jgi:environmental stress-induced protein Ves
MQIIRAQDGRRMRWKDGGGETVEIAISPQGADLDSFEWRISTAEVATSGPFSTFPGVDRTLIVLSDAAMDLTVAGRPPIRLTRDSAPYAFPGDAACAAQLVDGPVRDFNVMSRRACMTHLVERRTLDRLTYVSKRSDWLALYMISGKAFADDGSKRLFMNAGDTLLCGKDIVDCEFAPRTSAELILVHLHQLAGAETPTDHSA